MEWHDILIEHTPASVAIDMKNQLIQDGLVHGTDFEWRFTQSAWDGMTGVSPSSTRFSFRSQAMATFYQLKWQ